MSRGKTLERTEEALVALRALRSGRHHAEPMAERRRILSYQRANGSKRITPRQRRRWVKKAMSSGQWPEGFFLTSAIQNRHWPNYDVEFHEREAG